MGEWGVVRYNKRLGLYYVDGVWKKKREYLYKIPVRGGFISCTSRANALELRSIINSEIIRGIFNPARYKKTKPLHLDKFAERWILIIAPTISHTTLYDYNNSLKNYIVPFLGNDYLPDITGERVKEFNNWIRREPAGKKNVLGCLHKMLVDAKDWGYILEIPKFPTVRLGKKAVIWIDQEDQELVLSRIPKEDRYIYRFLQYTGCRPSEARAFRKIDIQKQSVLFRVAFDRYENEVDIKTDIERTFPMFGALRGLLGSAPPSPTPSPYVFWYSKTGRRYTRSVFNRLWNRACDEAGVPRIKLYNGTKHSLGCQLINAGVDKKIVQQLFGHSDGRMTDRYAEASPTTLRKAVNKVRRIN